MAETRRIRDPRRVLEETYGESAIAVFAAVDELAATFVHPDLIMRALRRFVSESANPATELRSLEADPLALECLVRLAGCSCFGMGIAIFEPRQFWSVVQDRIFRQVWGRQLMREECQRLLARHSSLDACIACLIGFQHRHLLRIMLGDVMQEMTLAAITGEIADLADVCVQAALDLARQNLGNDCPGQDGFMIFAMGKLGARELNYSSDIDLVFSYHAQDSTAHDALCRIGQEVIRILDSSFAQGRLYRVDMRLRPEGAAGPLAISDRELHDYCYSVGRSWERQAWIKARVIAGDLERGNALLDELQAWIYPKDPRWEQLKDAALMRQRIEERCRDDDVKIGAGGIRDIEFLVQYYQLGWGGRFPELRQRSTLSALDALHTQGLLSRSHHQELREAYVWLRMLEHRLQMWESRQLHALPDQEEQRRHVADRCGYHGTDGLQHFEEDLARWRQRVRALAQEHYLDVDDERMAAFALIQQQDADPGLYQGLLSQARLSDSPKAIHLLRSLAREPFFLLRRSRTEHLLADLLPPLLTAIGRSPQPDRALLNFVRIVDSVGGRALFYEQLTRHPDTLRRLTNLAGWADSLVDLMVAHPGLADEIVERLRRGSPDSAAMLAELQDVLDNQAPTSAALLPTLRFFHARELIATAIEDLEGMAPWTVCRHLSHLAQAIIQILAQQHQQHLQERWGQALQEDGSPDRFAIIGLGKSGSCEMTYSSDVDLLFIHDAKGPCSDQEHQSDTFWERVAQGIIHDCQQGQLYEVDARLRPWGDQGPLVTSMEGLRYYWQRPRDLWERLAYTRMSLLAGDAGLAREAMELIRSQVQDAPLATDATAQVLHMRRRLEESVADLDHVKRGWGGYVDIEFLVQYALLGGIRAGQSNPEIPERHALDGLSAQAQSLIPPMLKELHRHDEEPTTLGYPTANTLVTLTQSGHFCPLAGADLLLALTLMRWVESRMRLYAGKAISHLPTEDAQRQAFARCAGYDSVDDLNLDLHLLRERSRWWFDYYMGQSKGFSGGPE